MPTKRKKAAKKGAGFWGSVWDKAKEAGKALHQVAKDRKVISGALKSMGHNNVAKMVANQGYGRKKKRAAPRRGKGMISEGLHLATGVSNLFGLGRRRGRGAADTVTAENVKLMAF